MSFKMLSGMLLAATLGVACANKSNFSAPPVASPVSEAAWTRIGDGMDSFLGRLESLEVFAPGAAVIVTTADGRRYIRVHGELKVGAGHPANEDSAFYIASMTKAYVGLLAARLDAEGVLPLDMTLADAWPGLRLPEGGRQAGAITMRDLLHHNLPFEVEEITFLEAYVRDVAPDEYPNLIAQYATPREDGYKYDNLGYNIYAAVLEHVTGKNWRDWLREGVFSPLKMSATSGLTSDYGENEIAWSHQRAGAFEDGWPREGGWYVVPHKTDGMMQSAGGLMTSAHDMALWMEAHLKGAGPARSGLTPEMFATAQEKGPFYTGDGHGFSCDGYTLGWNNCELLITAEEDQSGADMVIAPLLQHGGGYIGVRSLMTVSPELGLGVAFLSNSDSMTGYMSGEIAKLAFELLEDVPGAAFRAERRIDTYADRNRRYLDFLQNRLTEMRSDEQWQGWRWRPAPDALAGFAGDYNSETAFLRDAAIYVGADGLRLKTGERVYRLSPAAPDLFGAQSYAYDEIAAVRFVRNADGGVIGFEWDDHRYERR
ncbi:MAG: serine hydrolase domain-containing protein [Pseudomonadota bacterium]